MSKNKCIYYGELDEEHCERYAKEVIDLTEELQGIYEYRAFLYAMEKVKKKHKLTKEHRDSVWIKVYNLMEKEK